MTYGRDLTDPASPRERIVNFNCSNKPKEIYTISDDSTLKTSLTYDADGRRILKTVHSASGKHYPSDFVAADSGNEEVAAHVYDPRRIGASDPGFALQSATVYIGDYFEKTTRDDVAWQDVKYIFAAGRRIAKIDSAGVHYFHKDHLGSTNVVTDENGDNPSEASQHMPFGDVWRAISIGETVKYKFTDQEVDNSTLCCEFSYVARFSYLLIPFI